MIYNEYYRDQVVTNIKRTKSESKSQLGKSMLCLIASCNEYQKN